VGILSKLFSAPLDAAVLIFIGVSRLSTRWAGDLDRG